MTIKQKVNNTPHVIVLDFLPLLRHEAVIKYKVNYIPHVSVTACRQTRYVINQRRTH